MAIIVPAISEEDLARDWACACAIQEDPKLNGLHGLEMDGTLSRFESMDLRLRRIKEIMKEYDNGTR